MTKYSERISKILEEPGFKEELRKYREVTPPKRKIPIIIDHDVPQSVIDDFIGARVFKILEIVDGKRKDPEIYQKSVNSPAALITRDEGFWDDRQYPLGQSRGLFIIKGKTDEDVDLAFALLIKHIDIVGAIRRDPSWFYRQKFKVSLNGYTTRYLTYESKVVTEEVEY